MGTYTLMCSPNLESWAKGMGMGWSAGGSLTFWLENSSRTHQNLRVKFEGIGGSSWESLGAEKRVEEEVVGGKRGQRPSRAFIRPDDITCQSPPVAIVDLFFTPGELRNVCGSCASRGLQHKKDNVINLAMLGEQVQVPTVEMLLCHIRMAPIQNNPHREVHNGESNNTQLEFVRYLMMIWMSPETWRHPFVLPEKGLISWSSPFLNTLEDKSLSFPTLSPAPASRVGHTLLLIPNLGLSLAIPGQLCSRLLLWA